MNIYPHNDATHEPVTVDDVKAFCRITNTLEDDTLTELIKAARELCERTAGAPMTLQTYTATYQMPVAASLYGLRDRIHDHDSVINAIQLPRLPLNKVNSVTLMQPHGRI